MSFSLFAYKRGDDTVELRRDRLPFWRVGKAVEWALDQGCDSVLVDAVDVPHFERVPGVVEHSCSDPKCPGGCLSSSS